MFARTDRAPSWRHRHRSDHRSPAAEAYLGEIRKITQAPIRYVVYIHHDPDHISGGIADREKAG
jgi:glyoxylase-like metal-dependent hydrolase (beta-lactamase superfamily II)